MVYQMYAKFLCLIYFGQVNNMLEIKFNQIVAFALVTLKHFMNFSKYIDDVVIFSTELNKFHHYHHLDPYQSSSSS